MTNDNDHNQERPRRGSVGNAVFSNIFQRSNSVSTGTNAFPSGANMSANDAQRRRLSISTLGLHGTSPPGPMPFGIRRASLSTNNSDVIDENAVDDEDGPSANPKTAPTTPFTRRMSFGTNPMRNLRSGGASPGTDQHVFNWSEQLRSRAESSVSGSRPSFSFGSNLSSSPPRANVNTQQRPRQDSTSVMPAPPVQAPTAPPKQPERPKPDHFQERILKGDFYMD